MYKKLLLSAALMLSCANALPVHPGLINALQSCSHTFTAGLGALLYTMATEKSINKEILKPLATIAALSTVFSAGAGSVSRIFGDTLRGWYCAKECSDMSKCDNHDPKNPAKTVSVGNFFNNHSDKIATFCGLSALAGLSYKYCS